ncbi:MAG: M48 family metalloprotease [Actinomycetota bacterium]
MYEAIAENRRRTVVLVGAAIALLGAVGYALGYLYSTGPTGMVVALAVASLASWGSYRYGDRIVLRSTRAKEVTAEEEPRLHNIVEGLAIAAGIPKPRLYVVPEDAPNAFATGRDPEHASIAVTRGLLERMDRLELEGVIGHELAHVADRDILLGTIVATLIGAVVLISDFFVRSMWFGGFGGRRDDRESGPLSGIFAIVGLLLVIAAPIIGQIVKLAVSRQREYQADAQGVLYTRYPPGLIAALKKIEAASDIPMRTASNATAHLWLSQPSRIPGPNRSGMESLFSTHPPVAERIRRLAEM